MGSKERTPRMFFPLRLSVDWRYFICVHLRSFAANILCFSSAVICNICGLYRCFAAACRSKDRTLGTYDAIAAWYEEILCGGSPVHALAIPALLELAGEVEGQVI